MSKKSLTAVAVVLVAVVLASCKPTFPQEPLTATQQGSKVLIDWPAAIASEEVDPVVAYEMHVDQSTVATISPSYTRCLLQGLSAGTNYEVELYAIDVKDHRSDPIVVQFTTPLVDDSANPMACSPIGD